MTMQTNEKREMRLKRAKVQLVLEQPFFGNLVARLPQHLTPGAMESNTACTDGTCIHWHPEFLDSLPDRQVAGVLAHEVLHVAMGHHWRRDTRDVGAWNIAADLAINCILKEAGLDLPQGYLYPEKGEEGHSAEHYYKAPQGGQSKKPQGGQSGQGQQGQGKGEAQPGQSDPGGCGGVIDAPGGEEGKQQQEAEWKVAVAQAAMAAKAQGKLPGSLARAVDEIVNPKVAWEVLLRDFVERTARNDFNWTVANKRHLGRGIILPSLISEELPAVVLVVDTSGSIGKKELDQFCAEASSVLGCYETTIHIVYADSKVAHHHMVTRADLPLKLEPKGGGGTDFRPAFEWVAKEGIQPAALIYLTDGMGTFPSVTDAEYPVLWVMTSDKKAPMGETVRMEM